MERNKNHQFKKNKKKSSDATTPKLNCQIEIQFEFTYYKPMALIHPKQN